MLTRRNNNLNIKHIPTLTIIIKYFKCRQAGKKYNINNGENNEELLHLKHDEIIFDLD